MGVARARPRGRKIEAQGTMTPSEQVDQLIAAITDWRGKVFAAVRKTILEADPEIVEEFKWMGSPVWSRDGLIAVGGAHKGKVKITFAHGAHIEDPDKLFNFGFEGNARRGIDFLEGDKINAAALKRLVRAAIVYNQTNLKKNLPAAGRAKSGTAAGSRAKNATAAGRAKSGTAAGSRAKNATAASRAKNATAASRTKPKGVKKKASAGKK